MLLMFTQSLTIQEAFETTVQINKVLQWNLNWSKSLGTSQIHSLNRGYENLVTTNLRGNDQKFFIKVIVNDWFVIQMTSLTQFNALFVTQKCHVLRCNSLSMVTFEQTCRGYTESCLCKQRNRALLCCTTQHFQISKI